MTRSSVRDRQTEADWYWREKVCGDKSWGSGAVLAALALVVLCVI
jgi:hypothetical protein